MVKRWQNWCAVTHGHGMAEAPDGMYVTAFDYGLLAALLAECEAENARLVAANKARDEFLRGHRYKHSEVDGYIDLCESQIAALRARLAEAERYAGLAGILRAVVADVENYGSSSVRQRESMAIARRTLREIDAAMASETVSEGEK